MFQIANLPQSNGTEAITTGKNEVAAASVPDLSLAQLPRFVRQNATELGAATPQLDRRQIMRDCVQYLNSRINHPVVEGDGFSVNSVEYDENHRRISSTKPSICRPVSVGERTMSEQTLSNLDMRIFLKKCFDQDLPILVEQIIYESVKQPPRQFSVAQAKQDAVRELANDASLRDSIRDYVALLERFQSDFQDWNLVLEYNSRVYKGYQLMREDLPRLVEGVKNLPATNSPYLEVLKDRILELEDTTNYRYVTQGVKKGIAGIAPIEPASETSNRAFQPYPYTLLQQGLITGVSMLSCVGAAAAWTLSWQAGAAGLAGTTLGLLCLGIGSSMRTTSDGLGVVGPMIRQLYREPKFWNALEAVGRMGELLAYCDLANSRHRSVFPTLSRGAHHCFQVKQMVCPSERNNRAFVPVSIDIADNSVSFITGPNSAGKTRTGKTISYTQALAQNGAPVFCTEARIGIADEIVYQSRTLETISDSGGDLETSLQETAEIINGAGPHSLLMLDEPAKGTSSAESNQITRERVIVPLLVLGSSSLIISHKFEVAQEFADEGAAGVGFFQMEVLGDRATHRIIPGIASTSLAHQVADSAGLSIQALQTRLRQVIETREHAGSAAEAQTGNS